MVPAEQEFKRVRPPAMECAEHVCTQPRWSAQMDGRVYGRGGTNVGGTYVMGFKEDYVRPIRLEHGKTHTKQWEESGFLFIPKYFMAGTDPCHNRYEIDADLGKGGYLPY